MSLYPFLQGLQLLIFTYFCQAASSASIVFSHLQCGQSEVLSNRRWVWGRLIYVSALRLDDGELLIIISSDSPTTAISDYASALGH